MTRNALKTLAAVSALSLATPALANVEVTSNGPIVQLSVTETVKAEPDMVTIGAGVSSRAKTAVEAMRTNAREMTAVIDRLKALGVEERDIQTSGISLYPQYDYNRATQQQVFTGYQASNRVSVILREIDETGELLDALVAAGATDISGPSFSMEDDTAAKAQARQAAMKRAEAMARDYANWSGFSNIRLLEVSESVNSNYPQPMLRTVAVQEAAPPPPPISAPVEPGLIGTSVTVSVVYEMEGR
ncbi:SIMPL domain-containing protein [Erythrobacter sp. HKB08]|uniref:SIMPL domain-containing protein n=1 Tax=Erythrobacter sp. HKB08 TaxID=2502843 RepID=UPI00100872CE|nr:SIMPL domain-containing protein [Erythrobacter sp. HKB08]